MNASYSVWHECTDQRLFAIFEAMKRGLLTIEQIHDITMIDIWFLAKIERLVDIEKRFDTVKNGTAQLDAGTVS
jgi:carbamoyl-phosphate synthase large subunit